jgi:hypothetical protein
LKKGGVKKKTSKVGKSGIREKKCACMEMMMMRRRHGE